MAYSPLEQPFLVICEVVVYSPFQQPLNVIYDNCGLFSFSTSILCYMRTYCIILLSNSHPLLYRIIVPYSPFQPPFIVICEVVTYSPFQQPFIVIYDHCALFSFSTAIHCYIVSSWLNLLFNSHSLLYRIIVAYFRFQHPFIVICELVHYSPFQQPFIVI